MNLNFLDKYKQLSNVELLIITNNADEYQPEAVVAAKEILRERTVTELDEKAAEDQYRALATREKRWNDKSQALKEKTTDFLEPFLNPDSEVQPAKWLNLLLIVMAIQYLWSLYVTAGHFIDFVQCGNCRFDISVFFEFISLVYVPIAFYLVLKRRRWGWILLFADNLFTAISLLSQSYIFFKYWDAKGLQMVALLIPILIKSAFAYFLWRQDVSAVFEVPEDIKRKTLLITIITCLIFNGTAMFVYG